MFMGEYQHTIDSKGRMIVPAKFREGLGEQFVLTRGLDQCLFGYPMSEWKLIEEKLKALPLTKKDARAFTRFFLRSHRMRIGQAGPDQHCIAAVKLCKA